MEHGCLVVQNGPIALLLALSQKVLTPINIQVIQMLQTEALSLILIALLLCRHPLKIVQYPCPFTHAFGLCKEH